MNDLGVRDPRWAGIVAEDVTVRGRPVHVLRRPADGPGTPQLLVHGLGGSSRNWLDVIGPLAAHGEVVALDLPGFGRTPIPDGGSARLRANLGAVRALLDTLGWERAVVHGGSMGGTIAAVLAAGEPDRVERLVLVNPALPAPGRQRLAQPPAVYTRILPTATPGVGRLAVELVARRRTAEQLVDDSVATVFADVARLRDPLRAVLVENADLTRRHRWRRRGLAEAANSVVAAIAEGRQLSRAVDAITAPTLLLWGDADRLVPRAAIDGLVRRRPDWVHEVLLGVGHTPMVEVPDAYVEIVGAWYRTG